MPGVGTNSGVANIGIYGVDDNTDNMVTGNYNTFLNGQSTLPPSGAGWSTSYWTNIRNTNYFLANYTKVKDVRANVAPYVGEAYFFKAWFYFDKLKTFGALPWLSTATNITDTTELYSPRDQEILLQIALTVAWIAPLQICYPKILPWPIVFLEKLRQAFRARVCLV